MTVNEIFSILQPWKEWGFGKGEQHVHGDDESSGPI